MKRSEEEVKQALAHNRNMEKFFEEDGNEASLNQFKGRVDALAWVLGEGEPTLDRGAE